MNKFNKRAASVVAHNGYLQVMLPDGSLFPFLTALVVKCGVDESSQATFTAEVNIVSSIEEAKRLYTGDGNEVIQKKSFKQLVDEKFERNNQV